MENEVVAQPVSGKTKGKVPLKAGSALLVVLGVGLGLLAGLGFSRLPSDSEQDPLPTVSMVSSPSAEPWSEQEQEQAITVATAVLSAYIAPYDTPASWQESMGRYGTDRFQSWTRLADPSWVKQGQVLSVSEASFPTSFEATITLKTTVGAYPIKLVQRDGQILVDEIVRQ